MQATEALTRLIEIADKALTAEREVTEEPERQEGVLAEGETAVAICQAMLNTALPVARFRVFVQIESGREKGREYTICATRIEDIVAALYPLGLMSREIYVTLWEQRPTGADMIEGYQGNSSARISRKPFRGYLDGLRKYCEVAQ